MIHKGIRKNRMRILVLVFGVGGIAMGRASLPHSAVRDARQPVVFSHRTHAMNQIPCTSCHEGATNSRQAGVPGVKLCLGCHDFISTNQPSIRALKDFALRGEEIPWIQPQEFTREAAVYFSHKRHAKTAIPCQDCHGNISQSESKDTNSGWSMGRCLECHKHRGASIDCLTCHF
jgi:predicted CXXCH cytochrome family protein